ncbi:unnamed protein product [Caretta caretta]
METSEPSDSICQLTLTVVMGILSTKIKLKIGTFGGRLRVDKDRIAETLTSKDEKIKVSYLPKNTMSKIQPFNQGIIDTFKMNYRKALVKKIVEDNSSIMDVIKKLNLLDVFKLGETAWLGITLSMIEKCWHHGLKSAFVTESDDNQDEEEDEDENNFEGFTEEEAMEAE